MVESIGFPIFQSETLEVLAEKLKNRQDPIEELRVLEVNLKKHLDHLDEIE